MPTPQKETSIAELVATLGTAQAAIIADYRGLTVEQLSELRKRLRPAGARFMVVKNTLLKIALRQREMPTMDALLEGPNAVLFVDGDPVEATKILAAFVKEKRKNLPQVKGGLLGKRELTAEQAISLATMPTRQQAMAELVGAMQSAYAGLVMLMNSVPQSMLGTLDAYKEKQEGAA